MRHGFCELLCVALVALSTSAMGQQIRGDYLETRSADVYTGQCFANGEVNLVGDEGVDGNWEILPFRFGQSEGSLLAVDDPCRLCFPVLRYCYLQDSGGSQTVVDFRPATAHEMDL